MLQTPIAPTEAPSAYPQGWGHMHRAARCGACAWALHLHAMGFKVLQRAAQDFLSCGQLYWAGITPATVARVNSHATVAAMLEFLDMGEVLDQVGPLESNCMVFQSCIVAVVCFFASTHGGELEIAGPAHVVLGYIRASRCIHGKRYNHVRIRSCRVMPMRCSSCFCLRLYCAVCHTSHCACSAKRRCNWCNPCSGSTLQVKL